MNTIDSKPEKKENGTYVRFHDLKLLTLVMGEMKVEKEERREDVVQDRYPTFPSVWRAGGVSGLLGYERTGRSSMMKNLVEILAQVADRDGIRDIVCFFHFTRNRFDHQFKYNLPPCGLLTFPSFLKLIHFDRLYKIILTPFPTFA